MTETEKNPQLIYMDRQNAMGLSMGLMTFGYRQFVTTMRFQKLPLLKKLSEEFSPSHAPDFSLIADLAFNNLLDSIKVTVCFENFIKALLISNGFVIHKLDKNIFGELAKEQFSNPIDFNRVQKARDWEVVSSIDLPEGWMRRQIKGIGKNTIGMKELLSPEYLKLLHVPENIVSLCTPYFQYRNNLHLYAGEAISFTQKDYSDFTKIIDFVNNDLVRIQNDIIDKLKKGDQYKLPQISYS